MASTAKELKLEKDKFRTNELELIQVQKKLEIVSNQLNNEKAVCKELERKNFELENEVLSLKNDLKIHKQQHESYQVSHDGNLGNLEL